MITVRLGRRAQRYYERLDAETATRLDRALARLAENPFHGDINPNIAVEPPVPTGSPLVR